MSDEPEKVEGEEELPSGPVIAPAGSPPATSDPRVTHPVIPPTPEELGEAPAEEEGAKADEPVEQEGYRPLQEDDPA